MEKLYVKQNWQNEREKEAIPLSRLEDLTLLCQKLIE